MLALELDHHVDTLMGKGQNVFVGNFERVPVHDLTAQ
jgi:hypothetical protein